MARLVLRGSILKNFAGSSPTNLTGSILKKILIVAACVMASAWVQTAVAQAPHVGGHIGGGGHASGGVRMSAPPQPAISRPRVFAGPRGAGPYGAGPRLAGVGPRGFGFRQGPIQVFRRRVFFGTPFFRFGAGLGFRSLWWPACGPSLGWAFGWGFECYPLPYYGYGFENYVTLQTYENPLYLYVPEERDLVWLYLKDGRMYSATDYWFVNGQMHFAMREEGAAQPAEHVIPYDELDVQKTTYVNTHRGFRIVFRDEPWQQYSKDHPDLTPPDLPPPQGN